MLKFLQLDLKNEWLHLTSLYPRIYKAIYVCTVILFKIFVGDKWDIQEKKTILGFVEIC